MPIGRGGGLNRKSPLKRKNWEKKEHSDAEDFGGAVVAGSGNRWYRPSDVKTAEFMIDSKTTKHASYTVTEATWEKIRKEAIQNARLPILSIKTSVEADNGIEVVVVDKQDFLAMQDRLKWLRLEAIIQESRGFLQGLEWIGLHKHMTDVDDLIESGIEHQEARIKQLENGEWTS